jgi:serine/threonine protein kinase
MSETPRQGPPQTVPELLPITRTVVPESSPESLDGFGLGVVLQERYVLERELGRGAMGQVYLGRDRRLDRPVAVKVILPLDPELRNRTIVEGRLRESFADEARLGANLTHPAIATVYDFGFHQGRPFTVFEYVEGETLRDFLNRRVRLPLEEVRLLLGPLAQALDFAHGRQIVHRDLKPENVRVTPHGQLKVLDLGLAKEFRLNLDWRFAGTPAYASPEQAAHEPCDGRTDQYALAVIVYEMLTGHWPFEHRDWRTLLEMHRTQPPPHPHDFVSTLPDGVCQALLKALAKAPDQRFGRCEEFAVALGCQVLSAPVLPPEVLRETLVKRLSGRWEGWARDGGLFGSLTHVYLALTPDALWLCDDGQMLRWPLRSLIGIDRRFGSLGVRVLTGTGEVQQQFHFKTWKECGEWCSHLQGLLAGPAEALIDPGVEPVVLLRRRPPVRSQLLGPVEATAAKAGLGRMGLQVRAGLMGADAVVEVESERLPSYRQTLWRASGTALRAVDEDGRRELRTRWFVAEAVRLGAWMLGLTAVTVVLAYLHVVWLLFDGPPEDGSLPGSHPNPLVVLLSGAGLVLLNHLGPAILVVAFRMLQWPQLARPTAVAVGALGGGVLALAGGAALAVAVTGNWGGLLGRFAPPFPSMYVLCLFPIPVLAFALARRTWLVERRFREMVPLERRQPTANRRVLAGLFAALAGVSTAWLIGFNAWAGYVMIADAPSFDASYWAREAPRSFQEGEGHLAASPILAELPFQQAAVGYAKLADAYPRRPHYRRLQARSTTKLGEARLRAKHYAEAETACRDAVTLCETLAERFPDDREYPQLLELARQQLGPSILGRQADEAIKAYLAVAHQLEGPPREEAFRKAVALHDALPINRIVPEQAMSLANLRAWATQQVKQPPPPRP